MEVITPTVSQANIAPGETPLPRSTPPDARSIHSTRPREDGAPSPNKENEDGDKPKPLTGFKLWILFGAVIFATFLMALNGAILATVSQLSHIPINQVINVSQRLSLRSQPS